MTNYTRLVAVCCELRQGLEHDNILKNCKKVGEFLSKPEFTLIEIFTKNSNVGLKKGNRSVIFEVYEVNVTKLDEISRIKCFYQYNYANNLNNKVLIDTPYGEAYVFFETKTEITKDNIIKDYDYVDYYIYRQLLNK